MALDATARYRPTRRDILAATLASTAPFAASGAHHAYTKNPIKWVIPFTAGGGCDVTARLIAKQLEQRLGQKIIAENRPGASGRVAAAVVAQGPADGHTLLVGSATLAGSAVVSGSRAGMEAVEDFQFVGKIGQVDLMLVTPASLQVNDLRDLVSLMRSKPATMQYGSPGVGSISHLGAEWLQLVTRARATHIPYRGESAALSDLISGRLTFQLCAPHICVPRVQDGTLKALAVAARSRSPRAPTVPTTAQAGIPGLEFGTWWYLAAPKGTPAAVIVRLNSALNQVLSDEAFTSQLRAMGVEARPDTTQASVMADLRSEMRRWRPIAKAAGITA